jgi:hypothetical protein
MNDVPATTGTVELLTADEARTLAAHEDVIRRGMGTFVDVGNALQAIRDAKLYRQEHDTFEAYCRERWGFAKSQAYRLIDAASVAARLSPIGEVPQTESQARPLTKLPAEQQPLAWQAATAAAAADSRPVTAKDVQKAVSAVIKQSNPEPKEEPQEEPQPPEEQKEPPTAGTAMYHAAEAINSLRKIKQNDPARVNALRMVARWARDNE